MTKYLCVLPWVCFLGICLGAMPQAKALPQAALKSAESTCNSHTLFAPPVDAEFASKDFYSLLDSLIAETPETQQQLACLRTEVTELLTDKEERQYKALPTNQARAAFLKRFWLSQDPTPATVANERLIEHYERLFYAREHFSYPGSLGYDDRGKIYIKYGPPDEVVEDGINFNTLPFTTWAYYNLGAPICFDFIDSGVNGFRFADQPTDALVVPGILAYKAALENLLRRRINVHPDYARLYSEIFFSDQLPPGKQLENSATVRATIDRRVREYANDLRLKQYRLPVSKSTVAKEFGSFDCALRLAQFQGDNGKPVLLGFYGFHPADLRAENDSVLVRAVTTLRDTSLAIEAMRDTAFYVSTKENTKPAFIQIVTYSVQAEKYFFLLQLENPSSLQRCQRDYSLIPGALINGKLHLSSLIFAETITPVDSFSGASAFYRNGLAIVPHPFDEIASDKPVWLYFEAYDLAKDREGKTSYSIEYEITSSRATGFAALLSKLNPFNSKGEKISLSETRQGDLGNEAVSLQLDLAQLPPAKYYLTVRLTDHIAKLMKERELQFVLHKN